MATTEELKDLVEGWVSRVTIGEFDNPVCRKAWSTDAIIAARNAAKGERGEGRASRPFILAGTKQSEAKGQR